MQYGSILSVQHPERAQCPFRLPRKNGRHHGSESKTAPYAAWDEGRATGRIAGKYEQPNSGRDVHDAAGGGVVRVRNETIVSAVPDGR